MRIISLNISNILSIESATINFDLNGLFLVEGWNHDDGTANGAGKTAIFNALSFGLYGELPRKITATEILKKGAKNGYVEVVVDTGHDIIEVRRERPKKEFFKKNGVSVTMSQKEFESIIKLSYDQFLVSMYTAQSTDSKFINLNDADKKEFLLKLINLTDFNSCKKEMDEETRKIEKEIETLTVSLEKQRSSVAAYKDLKNNAQLLQSQLYEKNAAYEAVRKIIDALYEVKKPDFAKYAELEKKIDSQLRTILQNKAKRSLLFEQYTKLAAQDVPFSPTPADASCPYCDGELSIKGKTVAKIADMKGMKAQHEGHMTFIKQQLLALKQDIDALDLTIAKENGVRELSRKITAQKNSESEAFSAAESKIMEATFNSRMIARDIIVLEDSIRTCTEIEVKIAVAQKAADEVELDILNKKALIDVNTTVSDMFSPVGAPAYILDSIIDSLNDSVNTYVGLVWPNANYQLKSYRENAKGDITTKFSEELIVNGKERSVGSLSGGEMRCLSLAIDFAVIDVLSKQFGIALNPVVMDEPFEGLDPANKETIVELLEKLSLDRQIWIIDHSSEAKAMFSKIVRIEKRNGTSSIV